MKKAFTLVEVLIVVAIVGILAAMVVPNYQDQSYLAKEAAAKDNLRILRQAIEIYAAEHDGVPPGYQDNDPAGSTSSLFFRLQMVDSGNYISEMPENPFSGVSTIMVLSNDTDFRRQPISPNSVALYYKPAEKKIKLNWEVTDSKGVPFWDY